MKLRRRLTLARTLWRVWRQNLIGSRTAVGQELYDGFMQLGGIYIKFLQALLLRSDLMNDRQLADRLKVYEDVDFAPLDVHAYLWSELGETGFAQLQPQSIAPLAAGSFGQVYYARLKSGEAIAIKILRPELRANLAADLRLLRIAAHIIGFIKPSGMIDVVSVYKDFSKSTLVEADYLTEAINGQKMYEHFRGHPHIVIPKTYANLSTATVLTQEYIGGISAADLIKQRLAGHDIAQITQLQLGTDLDAMLEVLGFELLYSVFASDFTHGDPHPGNIKFLPGNRVAMLDFGLIGDAPANKQSFLILVREYQKFYHRQFNPETFSLAVLGMFAADLVGAVNTLGTALHGRERANIILSELCWSARDRFLANAAGDDMYGLLTKGGLLKTFVDIANEDNILGLKLKYDATIMMRGALVYMTLVNGLDRKEAVMGSVYDAVVEAVDANFDFSHQTNRQPGVNESMEIIASWLDRLSMSDPLLFKKLSNYTRRYSYV